MPAAGQGERGLGQGAVEEQVVAPVAGRAGGQEEAERGLAEAMQQQQRERGLVHARDQQRGLGDPVSASSWPHRSSIAGKSLSCWAATGPMPPQGVQ